MATKKKTLAPLVTRIKSDPALLARARKDPGLRSKLPDKYLTAAQLATRKQNQYLGDIGDISTPLAGTSLVNTAQQITNADYAPLLAGVGQQEQIVNKSAGLQGDWAKRYYGDLNGLIGSVGGAQMTANAGAVQGATDRGTATQTAIAASDKAAQDRIAQDAAVRGGGLQGDASTDLAARTAAAQQAATGDASRAQTSAQQFGDAQSAFLRGLQGATAQQGGEYQQQVTGAQNQALQQLAANRADLQGKQAGSYTDTLLKLRSGEQQNAITAAGLGVKEDAAAASADASAGSGGQKYGYTPSEWLALPASTRTAIVAQANKKTPAAKTGYGAGAPGMNKYGYTYDEWTALSAKQQADARAGKGTKKGSSAGAYDATSAEVAAAQTGTSAAQAAAKAAKIPIDQAHRQQLQALISTGRTSKTATVTQRNASGVSVTTKVAAGPDGQPLTQTVKGKDGKTTTKFIPAGADIDKQDPLYTSVALDVLIDGHVSRYNADRLHSRKLTVEDLGFPSYTAWKKTHSGKAQNSPSERAPGGT